MERRDETPEFVAKQVTFIENQWQHSHLALETINVYQIGKPSVIRPNRI